MTILILIDNPSNGSKNIELNFDNPEYEKGKFFE